MAWRGVVSYCYRNGLVRKWSWDMSTELEFSQRGYIDLLECIKAADYSFAGMSDALSTDGKCILLRHDVDFSVRYALEMANLENRQGVKSTYFFMTTSEFYNIFCEENRKAIRQIYELGHEIGLHWDSRFSPQSSELIDGLFVNQLSLLSEILGHSVKSASQHVPTDTPAIKVDHLVEVEAYSTEVMHRFAYVSDSSMQWREHTPLDLIEDGVSFQFLAHPIWWMSDGFAYETKFKSFLESEIVSVNSNIEKNLLYMKRVLLDRRNIDKQFANRHNRS